jgi:flagellar biosynthesis/type III secretory pathway protein FliH
MSKKRLTPLQAYRRGFLQGYRAAHQKCRADLHALAADFDSQIANLKDEARKELHSLAASFSAEIGNAIARRVDRQKINRAIQEAADERATIPDAWLH